MYKFFLIVLLSIVPLVTWADNSGNSSGFSWSEKIGWIHFSGEDAGIDYGVKISNDQISGYIWSEKAGWISLNCFNDLSCKSQPYGVVSDGEGNLSGFAWSEKGGWINFSGVGAVEYQVQVASNGNLSGYAWSEKVGWINTNDSGEYYGVQSEEGEAYCEDCVPCNPPVLAWGFDEGIGAVAHDDSLRGNNITNDGTLENGPIWQERSECVSGKCLYFDGNNDNVNRAYDTDLSFKENSFSIGTWFKSPAVSIPAYLMSRYDSAGWKLWLDADGDVCFGIDDDGTWSSETPDDYTCTSGKNYDNDTWHYVLAKKDFTNGIYIYLDGTEVASDVSLSAVSSLSGTNPTFYTALNSDGISSPFVGFLDDVKIYSYGRSDEQIRQDYNAGSSGAKTNRGTSVSMGDKSAKWMSDGLVGYWKMDESSWNGTAGEVKDVSGNNNHGTASGGASTTVGKFGNGGNFNGGTDAVLTNTSSSGNFTYSAWIKISGGGSYPYIATATNNNWFWNANSGTGKMQFYNGTAWTTLSTKSVVDNVWHHVVYTGDGNNIKGYIDGVLDTTNALSNPAMTVGVQIGRRGASYSLIGNVDEFRTYNRALSPDEIKQLYNYAPGPVMHLKMDEKVSGD
ncbi:MAG: hypothetical protein UR66_C0012G0033, partial [Candidatus Moranbacteria bacterium GW2011_GWE1_35_17]